MIVNDPQHRPRYRTGRRATAGEADASAEQPVLFSCRLPLTSLDQREQQKSNPFCGVTCNFSLFLNHPTPPARDADFGEQIALYFSFLGYYTLWLLAPCLLGIVVMIVEERLFAKYNSRLCVAWGRDYSDNHQAALNASRGCGVGLGAGAWQRVSNNCGH